MRHCHVFLQPSPVPKTIRAQLTMEIVHPRVHGEMLQPRGVAAESLVAVFTPVLVDAAVGEYVAPVPVRRADHLPTVWARGSNHTAAKRTKQSLKNVRQRL